MPEREYLQAWQQRGAMGKLHNFATWILRTPQRRDCLSQKVHHTHGNGYHGPVLPVVGNLTEWSSDADAIDCAFELRDILNKFVGISITEEGHMRNRQNLADNTAITTDPLPDINIHDQIPLDALTLDDWLDLTAIMFILKDFRVLTLQLQGTGSGRNHAN